MFRRKRLPHSSRSTSLYLPEIALLLDPGVTINRNDFYKHFDDFTLRFTDSYIITTTDSYNQLIPII